jgi:diacylglycerol kinase family enzyme
MRYAIITNPVSGKMTVDQKRTVLTEVAEILGAEIHGLDTIQASDLAECAQDLVTRCDVLVIAGGDGTLSDIINAIDTARTPIAYLPMGTGNAMMYALKYKGSLADMARRIRDGAVHEYDLIHCDEKRRAFMASMGIEGSIIRLRERYRLQGTMGFKAYFRAVFMAYVREYKRTTGRMTVDDMTFEVKDLLSLMVTKQPYYGFGMNVVPEARLDDCQLHILSINSGVFESVIGAIASFVGGNRIGHYRTSRQLTVDLERPLILQVDGNDAWEADTFKFKVLPNALKIKC